MPRKTKNQKEKSGASTRPPEVRQAALKLASLAMAWMNQDQRLGVRQREELRRALATTAEFRGWAAIAADPTTSAIKDVKSLTKAGSQYIARDLENEMADKKTEVSTLRKVADSIHKLAGTADWEEPIEVSYSHTVREGDGLATKTETLSLVDAGEAEAAAASMEKKLDNWEKLRAQMLIDLKARQRQLNEMRESISAFAEFSRSVVDDVLAILI